MGAAVLAAQNPWGHTLSWSQPSHFWVTVSHDPRRDIPFITALLPESRVLYVSAPPPLSWVWGQPHLWNAQVQSCRRNCTATTLQCAGIRPTLWPQQQQGPGSGCVQLCQWSGEGLGISSLELAARVRRGRRQQAPADRDTRTRR